MAEVDIVKALKLVQNNINRAKISENVTVSIHLLVSPCHEWVELDEEMINQFIIHDLN